jgi:hypothetical protein
MRAAGVRSVELDARRDHVEKAFDFAGMGARTA